MGEHLVLRAWLRLLRALLPPEEEQVALAVLVVEVGGGRQGRLAEVVFGVDVCAWGKRKIFCEKSLPLTTLLYSCVLVCDNRSAR